MSNMITQKHTSNGLEILTIDGYRKVDKIVDYSAKCEDKIAAAKSLAARGELGEAINMLLMLEKQTRAGNDVESTRRILISIVQLCFDAKEWGLLNEHLIWLNQRKSQFIDAVTPMIKECISFIERTPNEAIKSRLIECIRIVTRRNPLLKLEHEQLTKQLFQLAKC